METWTIIGLILATIIFFMSLFPKNAAYIKLAWNIILSIVSGIYFLKITCAAFNNPIRVWGLKELGDQRNLDNISDSINKDMVGLGFLFILFSFFFFWVLLRFLLSKTSNCLITLPVYKYASY